MSPAPPIPAELWEQIPPDAQAAVAALVARYEQRLEALEQQVRGLVEQLNRDSTNSSQPPSADAPAVKRRPPRPASGRRKGGQPGHPPHRRPLVPPEQVQQTIPVRPAACRRCGHALEGDDPEPLRHQVAEIPPVRPTVIEYQLHRLCCPACATRTCAGLPAGVPQGGFGPRLQSVLALLAGAYRLGKRPVSRLASDLFGLSISAGMVSKLERATAEALAGPVAQAQEYVQGQPANVDETSWRQQGRRGWLWVAVTALVSVFLVRRRRDADVLRELVGAKPRQVITSDRYTTYETLPLANRQVCWAHLRRDFQAMIDRDNEGKRIGDDLLTYSDMLFGWWHRVRDGTLTRRGLRRKVAQLRGWVGDLLKEGAACGCAKTEATCRELLALGPALWTFAYADGVEPTNNAAERALRHAVCWRKTSYGTDSEAGGRFVERVLTVVETCRQQGRNVLDYLTACCEAVLHRTTLPSLLPKAATG